MNKAGSRICVPHFAHLRKPLWTARITDLLLTPKCSMQIWINCTFENFVIFCLEQEGLDLRNGPWQLLIPVFWLSGSFVAGKLHPGSHNLHVPNRDTLLSSLQEASLFPGSPQDPFLYILQGMAWVVGILMLFSWFLCPSEPGYHRAGCIYLITWKLCSFFCKSWAAEPCLEIWSGSHFCFVERHQISFTLFALFRERDHVNCFRLSKTWEEFSNPGSGPVISLWLNKAPLSYRSDLSPVLPLILLWIPGARKIMSKLPGVELGVATISPASPITVPPTCDMLLFCSAILYI